MAADNAYTGVPITFNRCNRFPVIKPITWCFINSVNGAMEYALNNINKHVSPLSPDEGEYKYNRIIKKSDSKLIKLFKFTFILQRIYVYFGDALGGGKIYNVEPTSYDKLITVDADNAKWNDINGKRTNEIVQEYFKNGHNIVRINNVMDTWNGQINDLLVIKEGVDRVIKEVIFNEYINNKVMSIPWIRKLNYLFEYE